MKRKSKENLAKTKGQRISQDVIMEHVEKRVLAGRKEDGKGNNEEPQQTQTNIWKNEEDTWLETPKSIEDK